MKTKIKSEKMKNKSGSLKNSSQRVLYLSPRSDPVLIINRAVRKGLSTQEIIDKVHSRVPSSGIPYIKKIIKLSRQSEEMKKSKLVKKSKRISKKSKSKRLSKKSKSKRISKKSKSKRISKKSKSKRLSKKSKSKRLSKKSNGQKGGINPAMIGNLLKKVDVSKLKTLGKKFLASDTGKKLVSQSKKYAHAEIDKRVAKLQECGACDCKKCCHK